MARRLSWSFSVGAITTDVGRGARPSLLAIRSQRHDRVRTALGRSAVDIEVSPRIGRHGAGLEIGSVPDRSIAGSLRQSGKTLAASRVPADVEVKQVERTRETLDLQFGRLDFGIPEITEHTGTYQAHDQ